MCNTITTLIKRGVLVLIGISLPFQSFGAGNPSAEEPTPAGGIRTEFGDVVIENVGIGQNYNLRDLVGKPYKVTNSGASTMDLVLEPVVPTKDLITKGRQEVGFEPIPSIDWIKLGQTRFLVPSKESAYTDIIVSIPNDPSLYGRKFQASINAHSTGGDGLVNIGIWTHLMLVLAKSPAEQAEIEKNRKRGIVVPPDYSLQPDKVYVEKVPLGQRIDIRKTTGSTIKIANNGNEAVQLQIHSMLLKDTPLSLQKGFEEPTKAEWLKIREEKMKLEPDVFGDPGLSIELPNDPTLHKKKLMFVIKVEPADTNTVGITYYGRVYVEVE